MHEESIITGELAVRVLDQGYIRIVKTWGDDQEIVDSARVSVTKAMKRSPTRKLLRDLLRQKHMSPFGHVGMTLEVGVPLFVADQWLKHDSFFEYSMVSARYSVMPDEAYLPPAVRRPGGSGNRQQSGGMVGDNERLYSETLPSTHYLTGANARGIIESSLRASRDTYDTLIDHGVERGLARIVLPTAQYTAFRTSGSLRGWLHFLEFRDDPAHAQSEITQYASVIAGIIERVWPLTFEAYEDYIKNAVVIPGPVWTALSEVLDLKALLDRLDTKAYASEVKEFVARVEECRAGNKNMSSSSDGAGLVASIPDR